MNGWEKFLVAILICIVLFFIFAEGVGVGRREANDCTNPRRVANYLGRSDIKPYTVYQCDEGLRAFYDSEYVVVTESRVELK